MKNKIDVLFKNLCCSRCKSDFDEESISVLRKESSMYVINLHCNKCGKDFGVSFLGSKNINAPYFDKKKTQLRMIDDKLPISGDDVIDAHEFLKDLDTHWQNYLQNEESKSDNM